MQIDKEVLALKMRVQLLEKVVMIITGTLADIDPKIRQKGEETVEVWKIAIESLGKISGEPSGGGASSD